MIATAYSGPIIVAIGLIATVLTVIAGVAVWSVFKGSRAQALTSTQQQALDALNVELSAYQARADRLETENRSQSAQMDQQEKRISAQDAQIKHLNEMVTQVAKVDVLTAIVKNGFHAVGVPEETLMRGITTSKRRRSTDWSSEGSDPSG